jgi:hypothetical protein
VSYENPQTKLTYPMIYLLGNLIEDREFLSTLTDSPSGSSSAQVLAYSTDARRRMRQKSWVLYAILKKNTYSV